MNLYEFILQGGLVTTSSGKEVSLFGLKPDDRFKIQGYVLSDNPEDTKPLVFWDENGIPDGVSVAEQLNLVPKIPVTRYHTVSTRELAKYTNLQEFIDNESKKL